MKDSSSDEAAQNNPTDGGTAPSTTPVPPENVVGGRPYRETSPYHRSPVREYNLSCSSISYCMHYLIVLFLVSLDPVG